MIKKFLLVLAVVGLSGCGCMKTASWDSLSEREQQTIVIAGSILVAGFVVAHSNDTNVNNCISTRSLETGCGKFRN